jgi:hypothetical protein
MLLSYASSPSFASGIELRTLEWQKVSIVREHQLEFSVLDTSRMSKESEGENFTIPHGM